MVLTRFSDNENTYLTNATNYVSLIERLFQEKYTAGSALFPSNLYIVRIVSFPLLGKKD